MQLDVLSSNIPDVTNRHDLCSVLQSLRDLVDSQRALLTEVCTLVTLIVSHASHQCFSE